MNYSDDNKSVRIIFNGKGYDRSFKLTLPNSVNSLKRLKDTIINNINVYTTPSKLKIFNYKGIEIDDADIDYLTENQLLYISLDGNNFSIQNYNNEYEYIKSIKSGGYGKVFLAKHVLTGKLVAIKQSITNHLSNDEVYNISREALYLESFKHKNIIKCINSYSFDNNFYMVMQYAEGGELANYVTEMNWLTEKECKNYFAQMVDAVSYMHTRNVIHRDLKPNNILFLDKSKDNIAIIDFGISGYSCGNVQEKVKAGTLKFVPPEVASGLNYTSSTKIDIWALGIILYYMLFGIYPFEGKEDYEINQKIVKENFKVPINIPISKSCLKLLKGLLEKNPMLRIELNSPIINDWINDETKLNYQKKKVPINNEEEINISESDNNNVHISMKTGDLVVGDKSKNNSENNTNNLELIDCSKEVEYKEIILREPAKFENSNNDEDLNNNFNNHLNINKGSNSNYNRVKNSLYLNNHTTNNSNLNGNSNTNRKHATVKNSVSSSLQGYKLASLAKSSSPTKKPITTSNKDKGDSKIVISPLKKHK